MDYKNFFLTNNGSGNKTKEKYIKKNYEEIYIKINSFIEKNGLSDDHLMFKEKVYLFINNIKKNPKCHTCGEKLKFKRSLKEGYGKYCTIKCTNKSSEHKDKIKNTFKLKYGGHPMKDETIKEKVKNTNIKRYGVENIFKKTEYIKNKTKEKLGVTNPNKLDYVKNKRKNSNLKKYGVTTNLLLINNRVNNQTSKLLGFNEKYKSLNVINDKGNYVTIHCDKCSNDYDIERSLLFYRFGDKLNCCTICNTVNELRSIKEK